MKFRKERSETGSCFKKERLPEKEDCDRYSGCPYRICCNRRGILEISVRKKIVCTGKK